MLYLFNRNTPNNSQRRSLLKKIVLLVIYTTYKIEERKTIIRSCYNKWCIKVNNIYHTMKYNMASKITLFFLYRGREKEKSKYSFLSIFCITILVASISLPLITILEAQFSYAQSIFLKTFDAKVQLSNSTVSLGSREIVKVTVHDEQNEQPISGALVQETISYPDQITQQQVSSITDKDGQAIFTILASQPTPIICNPNCSPIPYQISLGITLTGYVPSFLSRTFVVQDVPSNPTINSPLSFSKTTGSIFKVSPDNIIMYSEDAYKGHELMNITAK